MRRASASIVLFAVILCQALLAEAATVIKFRDREEAMASNDYDCDCATTFELFKPICGSDGRSYPNLATLDCANECQQTSIAVQHDGLCTEEQSDNQLIGANKR